MENWKIRPPLPQKTPNLSSRKFAWVITAGTPTYAKFHYDTISPFRPPPQICENAHQVTRFFLVFPSANSQDPCTDFYGQYVK